MLAAITCLFGSGSPQRLANYHRFAADLREMGLPLYTVEATFPGEPAVLVPGSTVWQYALGDRQILWQKERLLNLAAARLPADVDAIAWLDADVLFDCRELPWAIEQVLQQCPVAQLWQYAVLLGPDGQRQLWPHNVPAAESLAAHNYGRLARGQTLDVSPRASHPGFAWAMRREAWDAMRGLYELDLGGVGDGLMGVAWLGAGRANPYLRSASPAMRADAMLWSDRAAAVIKGRVGYLPIAVGHLYHGPIRARQYGRRTRRLAQHGYDPRRHVSREIGQPLAWTDEAPSALVDWWKRFFCPLV
jgi:hypothetical protein